MAVVNEWIRPANREDEEAVRLLLDQEDLHEPFAPADFVVCEVDARIVGCARVRRVAEGGTEVCGLVVEFPYRRHGLARAMLEVALLGAHHPVHALAPEEWFMGHPSFEFIPEENLPPSLLKKSREHGHRKWLPVRLKRQQVLPAPELKLSAGGEFLDL